MAIHIFACIDTFGDRKMTSDFLAGSIGTNPVIVRKLLAQLKNAGLIEVLRGTGGLVVRKPYEDITFLDIYKAVEAPKGDKMFRFHDDPDENCLVGKNIHRALDPRLDRLQDTMEKGLESVTLADFLADMSSLISENETVNISRSAAKNTAGNIGRSAAKNTSDDNTVGNADDNTKANTRADTGDEDDFKDKNKDKIKDKTKDKTKDKNKDKIKDKSKKKDKKKNKNKKKQRDI